MEGKLLSKFRVKIRAVHEKLPMFSARNILLIQPHVEVRATNKLIPSTVCLHHVDFLQVFLGLPFGRLPCGLYCRNCLVIVSGHFFMICAGPLLILSLHDISQSDPDRGLGQ